MKLKPLDPTNPGSVVAAVQDFLKETQTVYQGMLDKVPDTLKDQVKQLKDKVDAALTQLASKPTEQVPAALDAAGSIRYLNYMIESMQEMINGTMEALNKTLTDYTPKVTALQSLQGRLDKKELVEASEVETRVKEAGDNARKAERERQQLLSTRRSLLAKADVPLPIEDAAIEGDDKAFTAVQTKATERTKKLKDLGQISAMNAEDLSKLIYGPDETYNFVIKLAENASKKPGDPDPMLGGRMDNKPRRLCIA